MSIITCDYLYNISAEDDKKLDTFWYFLWKNQHVDG